MKTLHATHPEMMHMYVLDLIAVIVLVIMFNLAYYSWALDFSTMLMLSAVTIVLGLVFAGYFKLRQSTTEFIVTDKDLQKKEGILNRRNVTVPLINVDNVTVRRSFTNRIFRIADVHIDTPSGNKSEIDFWDVEKDEAVLMTELINRLIHKSKGKPRR